MWQQIVKIIEQLLGQGQSTAVPSAGDAATATSAANDWWGRWQHERERRRQERVARRQRRKEADRAFFGEEIWGASPQQRIATTDEARLARWGLPVLRTEAELAAWLGITRARLRWFTHDRPADTVWHYVPHQLPKRRGGWRLILAPKRELKALQRTVLHELLARVPASDTTHGFVKSRSIATNAQPHVGQAVVLNLDLKDFFPSITYPRVRGLFIALGYSYAVASTLALLCTEHERELFERDDRRHFISVGPRCLPQGAPTSPALANLVAWRLDRRLAGLARKHGFTYTRYADDLTFSGATIEAARQILAAARWIIGDESFVVHPQKVQIARRSGRQVVTGLVVNDSVGTPRVLRRRLRAILHNARRTGLEGQNRDGRDNFRAYLAGMIGHIAAANARQAERLRDALHALH
jgi:RNA-directed DNA polymerase